MAIDTQSSLLAKVYTLLTEDASLPGLMGGTVRLFLTWATPDAEFPYLVHRLDIRREGPLHVVQRATHYLDIWSDSPNANEVLAIRKRLIEILDELIFSTDDVKQVHVEIASDGFVPQSEQNIWHYAMLFEWVLRRDAEAVSIEGR